MLPTVFLPMRWAGSRKSTIGRRAVLANNPLIDMPMPGQIMPPRYSALADTTSKLMVVPRSTTTAGPGPDARAERADHLGARARQARPVRQVAGKYPRLVDQPQPVLGQPDPGVEIGRPAVPADRRIRLAGRAAGRLRRRGN